MGERGCLSQDASTVANMTMVDVVKGFLVYEIPVERAERTLGGKRSMESTAGAESEEGELWTWEVEPFARISGCRLIPRDVRRLLPLVAPAGYPTRQQVRSRTCRLLCECCNPSCDIACKD